MCEMKYLSMPDGLHTDAFDSRGGTAVSGPLLDLGQFVDEEDAFALSLATGLHDPRAGWVLAELLHKEVIIGREHECHRNKICMKPRGDASRHWPPSLKAMTTATEHTPK